MLREEGELLSGDAFIVPTREQGLLANLEDAQQRVRDLHWRIYNVNMVPVLSFDGSEERHQEKAQQD